MKDDKKPTVTGHSAINHNVRVKLGITSSEYILLQYLQMLLEDGMVPDEHNAWTMLGQTMNTIDLGIKFLKDHGRITEDQGRIIIYPEWYKAHKEKGFEFSLFWKPVIIGSDTVSWRQGSSKEGTRKKFAPILKVIPIEQLIWNKLRYFFYKWESKSTDYIMLAETWLGPDRHYLATFGLKPDTQVMFEQMIRLEYGEGSQLDLTGMLPEIRREKQKPVQHPDKRWNDD